MSQPSQSSPLYPFSEYQAYVRNISTEPPPISHLRRKSAASEPALNQQESFISNRSRKASANKTEVPPSQITRSKSSFSLHILDLHRKHFEQTSLVGDSTQTSLLSESTEALSPFMKVWSNPFSRLYFFMYLIHEGNASIFVSPLRPFFLSHLTPGILRVINSSLSTSLVKPMDALPSHQDPRLQNICTISTSPPWLSSQSRSLQSPEIQVLNMSFTNSGKTSKSPNQTCWMISTF